MDLSIDRSTQKKETTKPWKRSVFKGFHAICPHFNKLMQKENYPSCEVIIVKKFGKKQMIRKKQIGFKRFKQCIVKGTNEATRIDNYYL